MISGSRREVYEKCALVGHYAACCGNSLSIECVHSAQRSKSLKTIQFNFRLQKIKQQQQQQQQQKQNHDIQNYKHYTYMQCDHTVTGRT